MVRDIVVWVGGLVLQMNYRFFLIVRPFKEQWVHEATVMCITIVQKSDIQNTRKTFSKHSL